MIDNLLDENGLKEVLIKLKEYVDSKATTPKPLEDCSWEEISEIAESGLAQYYFNVGDEKTINWNGYKVKIRIVDFSFYPKKDGNGKAGIVFQTVNCLPNYTAIIDESNNNEGGWEKMEIRNTTMQEILEGFDKDLQSVIKEVEIRSDYGTDGTSRGMKINTTYDKVFLPSIAELYSPYGIHEGTGWVSEEYRDSMIGENTQYLYYRKVVGDTLADNYCEGVIKYDGDDTTDEVRWWLRTSYLDGRHDWIVIDGNNTDDRNMNEDHYLAPCFCV